MRFLNRGVISPSGMFSRSHTSVALGKNTNYGRWLEEMTSKDLSSAETLWLSFPLPLICSDPTGWITKEQTVYSTAHYKSGFSLFLAPSLSPVKILWWLPSQDQQCGGAQNVLGYFYMTDLFGFHINNLIHLTFPPFLYKMHHICPTPFLNI